VNIQILLILFFVAASTSVLGVFLVLRRMSMLVDAISHTVLLGIVIAFIYVGDLSSPLLILGATLMGVMTVFLSEIAVTSRYITTDSAIGLVFSLLFSIAIIVISVYLKNVHLDIDAVLLGKIEFAPFDLLIINNRVIGPALLYVMLVVTIINTIFVVVFFKELKIISFDQALASTLGFTPFVVHYSLMFLVSLTSVAAFSAVGSILVVSMMIGPAASAVLLTSDLKKTVIVAPLFGIINSIIGYAFALIFDTNISGMIATVTLLSFIIVLFLNPKKGVITTLYNENLQKEHYAFIAVAMHIDLSASNNEPHYQVIQRRLAWSEKKILSTVKKGIKKGYFRDCHKRVDLTEKGRRYLRVKLSEIGFAKENY
jgi:manganese/zinc/iron transport system permease protein